MAAGLAATSHIAYTGSFAVFGTGRAYDQIRNTVCYSNLDVKIAPTHAGISVGPRRRQPSGCSRTFRSCAGFRTCACSCRADYAAARAAIRLLLKRQALCTCAWAAHRCQPSMPTGWSWSSGALLLREARTPPSSPAASRVEQALKAAQMLAAEGVERSRSSTRSA